MGEADGASAFPRVQCGEIEVGDDAVLRQASAVGIGEDRQPSREPM